MNIHIQDESGDKKYFTMVPNYILNHSSAVDQALYLQMKRFAGENGVCSASKHTLCKQLGVGRKALKKSLAYLVDHKWISYDGEYGVLTNGGVQMVERYRINDIWQLNTAYFQGVSKRTPPVDKGVIESGYLVQRGAQKERKGCSKVHKGVSESAPIENNIKTNKKNLSFSKIKRELKI